MVKSLLTIQEVPGSIAGSAVGFFPVENYVTVCTYWVLLCFFAFCLFSVQCCVSIFTDHSSGEGLHLFSYPYMCP